MALSTRQIEDIAADAVNLQEALLRHVSIETANTWVAAAMDAIVINVTDELEYAGPPGEEPAVFMAMDLKDPEAGSGTAVHAWLANAFTGESNPGEIPPDIPPDARPGGVATAIEVSARLGNLTGGPRDLAGINPAIIERLTSGPAREDEEMRLVRLDSHLASSEPARHDAESWVWDNVPGVAGIRNAQYAGEVPGMRRPAPGLPPQPGSFPVYLVTYQLAGDS